MKKKKGLKLLAACQVMAILCVMIAITGCGKKEEPEPMPEPVAEVVQDPEPEAEPEPEPEPEPEYISRLTGEDMKKKFKNKRPVALMIENTSMCQPHYGINKAGIIYECPVEGGITRLMGIFEDYSGLDRFGNVRSCRPYYVYIAKEFDAFYVHFGQSTQGKELLATGIVDNLSGLDGSISSKVFYRSSDKKAPHNAYTSTKGIKAGIKAKGYRKKIDKKTGSHFKFASADEPVTLQDGKEAAVVAPYFLDNKPYFIYDESDGLYYRFQFGTKEMDAASDKQVKVKNIIFQNVPSKFYADGYRLDLTLTGTGEGKYFTNGRYVDITWKKDSDTSKTTYFGPDGEELTINPGKTWVCIIEDKYESKNKIYESREDFK